jgi:hypothetical protein
MVGPIALSQYKPFNLNATRVLPGCRASVCGADALCELQDALSIYDTLRLRET